MILFGGDFLSLNVLSKELLAQGMFQGFFLQDLNRFGNWKFETNHFISLMKLVDKYSELLTIVYQ